MNHFISLSEAVDLTKRFRDNRGTDTNPAMHSLHALPLSEGFDRSVFDTILAQPDCASIRIYYGMDTDLKIHAIIVGVNSQNKDILPSTSANATLDTTDVIAENGMRCPDICSDPSPLNT